MSLSHEAGAIPATPGLLGEEPCSRSREDQAFKSFFLVMLSAACFAAMAVMTKRIRAHVPLLELTFYRGVFGLVPLTLILWHQRLSWKSQDWPILLSRGLCGLLATLCYFWALGRIPLALAVLLNYTAPIFTTVFAVMFLRETTTWASLGFLLLSTLGLYPLLAPSFQGDWTGYAVGLCAGALSGAAYTAVKHLSRTTSPWLIAWSFNCTLSLGCLPGVFHGGPSRAGSEWLWLIGISLAGTAGQVIMALGFRGTPVSRVSVATLFVLILTTLAGWLWWGETLSPGALVGMAAILAGIIGLGMQKKERK